MKINTILLGVSLSALLSGCELGTSIPKCSDESVISTVTNLTVYRQMGFSDSDVTPTDILNYVSIENPMLTETDESIKKVSCKAVLQISDSLLPITYSAQVDESGKDVYVELGSANKRDVRQMASALMTNIINQQQREMGSAKPDTYDQ